MATPLPSVGRIVHYVSYGTPGGEYTKECRAAIVTKVNGPAIDPITLSDSDMCDVDLCILNPTGMVFNQHCVQHEAPETETQKPGGGALNHDGGTWHWPERV
jgi:hypothetical protein